VSPIINPVAGGGDGGSGLGATVAHVSISAAQILNAPNVAPLIVTAPGVAKTIVPFAALLEYVPGTTPYAFTNGTAVGLDFPANVGFSYVPFGPTTMDTLNAGVTFAAAGNGDEQTRAQVENVPLNLYFGGNFSVPSNGDGTLRVTVYYFVATLG
jgi:hypothetical protein